MDPKELEKKLEELSRQLEKEKAEKKILETRLKEQSFFSVKKMQEWLTKARTYFYPAPKARLEMDEVQAPAPTKSLLEESVADDLATYRSKLIRYNLHQLEDIFLHIDREAHPERFQAIVEELRRRPAP